MWSSRWLSALLCAGLLAGAAGCGFQARSSTVLPESLQAIYVETADRYTSFYRELDHDLRARGLSLPDERSAADAVIRITRDDTGQRVVSVSAQNKPRQFEVYYTVSYAVILDGRAVLAPQTLTALRTYNYDDTRVLGKDLEEESLRDAMARDLVGRVLRRMSALD